MSSIASPLGETDRATPRDASGVLPDATTEALAFFRLRARILATILSQAMETARLRVYLLLLLTLIFWAALFWMFAEGFSLLRTAINHAGWQAQTVQIVFNLFFVALSAMLVVSSAIILYGGLYCSDEVAFLLTTPASAERIVLHKFHEAVLFSCWGFMLLGSPMLVAYGVVAESPWYYYALLLPFMVSFVFIPASIGALVCLLVVTYLPSIRLHAVVLGGIAILAGLVAVGWLVLAGSGTDALTPTWFHDVVSRLQVTEQRVLPSWWLSSGLLEAAHPASADGHGESWQESLWFLAVLASNALLLDIVVAWAGHRLLRSSYSNLQDVASPPASVEPSWIDRLVLLSASWLPSSMAHLLVKDVRIFRRDPVQWSQVAIFLGLLSLYFFNIKRFQYEFAWMNVIGYLNLCVVGLILSTFTTRFIFPLISLEGRRFWILGTLPIDRDSILWSKFLFALVGSLLPCSTLVLLSDLTLEIVDRSPLIAVFHQLTCWTLCVGLSAIAVGLGARLPEFREPSPSKIAAGFGGTLNLVVSALFILLVIFLTAVPTCCWIEALRPGAELGWTRSWWAQTFGLGSFASVVAGHAATFAVGAIASYVPLRLGLDAFRTMEV